MEDETPQDAENPALQVNPGYAAFQLAKALRTSELHEDPRIRERARKKIEKWSAVIGGLMSGTLDVGSRDPVKDIPSWATLEVVTGGFATGALVAGGPITEQELASLSRIAPGVRTNDREILNAYYVSDEGVAELQEQLRSGDYEISVPEEGALPVVAWLVEHGYEKEARSLLNTLLPFFSKLRFFPLTTNQLPTSGSRVYLQSAGDTTNDLQEIRPSNRILAQKEAIEIWIPLYDRIVELFLETVKGPVPNLGVEKYGGTIRREDGRFQVVGGWPCQTYPADWQIRATAILDDYSRNRRAHTLCGKPDRSKDSFAQLRAYLGRCVEDPSLLSARDVGRIRLILARYVAKRGNPNSAQCKTVRDKQANEICRPTFKEISNVVIQRLSRFPKDDGIDDLTPLVQHITDEEAHQYKIAARTPVPLTVKSKVERCLADTVDALVHRGIITSGETIARVLPQLTSGIRAAGITDASLRSLYSGVYRAFRSRRSLLLLNLKSQVKIEELPWVAAIEQFRFESLSTRDLARQTLEEICILTVSSFPHAILPNKLLQELRALAKGAKLDIPLTDELAADIFMGQFSNSFVRAAKVAANMLEGTLYARYFAIDYDRVRRLPEQSADKGSPLQRPSADVLAELCSDMAGVKLGGWKPSINGMVIEQQQIITSQNLAVLFTSLDLNDSLRERLLEMAKLSFQWICRRQQMKTDNWHGRLVMVKNTAYAWRQMLFYLALLPADEVQGFVDWGEGHLTKQTHQFLNRFWPAWQGLAAVAQGRLFDDPAVREMGARRFLGWTEDIHWLLA